jgi:hypothetical protein
MLNSSDVADDGIPQRPLPRSNLADEGNLDVDGEEDLPRSPWLEPTCPARYEDEMKGR